MKTCFKCNKTKELTEFYKHKQMADGYMGKCKDCAKIDVKSNHSVKADYYREYDKKRQRYSLRRIVSHRYALMKARVEGRATRRYNVEGKELLSQDQFYEWAMKNRTLHELYRTWFDSDFDRHLAPSIDRVDNSRGYSLDNIQWLSLEANTSKGVK